MLGTLLSLMVYYGALTVIIDEEVSKVLATSLYTVCIYHNVYCPNTTLILQRTYAKIPNNVAREVFQSSKLDFKFF